MVFILYICEDYFPIALTRFHENSDVILKTLFIRFSQKLLFFDENNKQNIVLVKNKIDCWYSWKTDLLLAHSDEFCHINTNVKLYRFS